MKKRIFTSLATIALASTLVGGATFAVFTSQAVNSDNTFKAGTLKVLAGPQTYSVPVNNLKPGDTITGSFNVSNDGTLPLNYTVKASGTGLLFTGDKDSDGIVDNYRYATVTIKANGTGLLAEKGASAGTSQTVSYEINFPTEANDDFQGATGALTFTVDANQQ